MNQSRLEGFAPDVAAALRAAPPERRAEAGLAAARWAVARVSLSHPAVWAALKACDCDGITALAKELDESYLSLSELREADPSLQPEVEAAFAKARAAAAVEFAAKGIPDEAIYEAAAAAESTGWLELRAVLLTLLADNNHAEPFYGLLLSRGRTPSASEG